MVIKQISSCYPEATAMKLSQNSPLLEVVTVIISSNLTKWAIKSVMLKWTEPNDKVKHAWGNEQVFNLFNFHLSGVWL